MLRSTPGPRRLRRSGSLVFGQIFFLHSSEVKQHPLRPCNLSFHSSLNTGQKVNRGMFFACSLQAVQIKRDRSTEVTWDDVAAVRLFWHEVGGQVGLRHTEVVGKRANVKTEKKHKDVLTTMACSLCWYFSASSMLGLETNTKGILRGKAIQLQSSQYTKYGHMYWQSEVVKILSCQFSSCVYDGGSEFHFYTNTLSIWDFFKYKKTL